MKLPTFLKVFFLLLISLGLFYSCNKDDNATPQVCCSTEVATTADFEFLVRVKGLDTIYWVPPSDTFYNIASGSGSRLYFRAKSLNMQTYEWKIGTDTRTFTDSLFFLDFAGINETVDVTLDVSHDVNLECFPNDNGIAAVTKSIIMKTFSSANPLPIYGKYEGAYEDNPNTVFQIEIAFAPAGIEIVYNFPYQCNSFSIMRILTTGGRGFIYDEKVNYQCGDPSGRGWLEPGNQTLIIEYEVDDPNDSSQRIAKRFVGQRI